jgi:glycosyltransferase involved in cell wall biosynthesis
MRLLFIAPCIPQFKGIGWEQRAFCFLKGYAQEADVDLICCDFDNSKQNLEDVSQLDQICRSVHIFQRDEILENVSVVMKLWRLFLLDPFFATTSLKPEFLSVINKSIADADLIHAFRLEMLSFVPRVYWGRVLLDLDECHVTLRKRQQTLNGSITFDIENLLRNLDSYRVYGYQKQAIPQVKITFVSSEVERKRLGEKQKISVVPNIAVNSSHTERINPAINTQNILFVGNISMPANIDAILYFVKEIWDKILIEKPDCNLIIAGRNPTEEILQLANQKGIKLYANVPDLKPIYQTATVAIAPIRFGAGTKIKVLEAFGFGIPVVSTSMGAEGLLVQHEKHLLIADSADDFAKSCIRLLNESETRQELALLAWEYFREKHDAQKVYDQITRVLFQENSMNSRVL